LTEQVEKMFEKLLSTLELDNSKFFSSELSPDHEKVKKEVEEILGDNIAEEIKAVGGKIDIDEFNKMEVEIQKQLQNPIFKPYEADLKKLVEKWLLHKKNEFSHHLFLVWKVKDFPFPTVTFLIVPHITWEQGKADRMKLNTDSIAFAGEIEALATRTVLYAKIAKEDPLFAPHIGNLDLAGYKPDAADQSPKSQNLRFVKEILLSLERKSTQNQVTRYDSQYERHGEPICDYFMQQDDLKKTMGKLTSALDSKRQASNAAVCAIMLPLIQTSMVIATDESSGMSAKKLETCFEGLLKFAAATYQSPNIKKGSEISQTPTAGALTPQAPAPSSGPQLQTWTEEDLIAEAAKRASSSITNLPVWTEEDLIKETANRSGINLPTWTEEELEKNRKMGTGMNVPDWKPDEDLVDCPKCGYTCKLEWGTCPMCDTPLSSETAGEEVDESEESEDEEEPDEEIEDEDSEE
jgi:hypothetical protein